MTQAHGIGDAKTVHATGRNETGVWRRRHDEYERR
jgi:predicted dithiol-disulfide oxidoreductase (DUF899 family)